MADLRYQVEKRYVVGFLFRAGEVLLIKKSHPEWQKDRFNGPGGKIEVEETPLVAMRREFHEETGFKWTGWNNFAILKGHDPHDGGDPFKVYFYKSEMPPNIQPRFFIKGDEPVSWHAVHAVPKDSVYHLKWMIPLAFWSNAADWPLVIQEKGKS